MKVPESISPCPSKEAVAEIRCDSNVPTLQEPAGQAEALKSFAEHLLEETEDSPQQVVDALNRHFWDLV